MRVRVLESNKNLLKLEVENIDPIIFHMMNDHLENEPNVEISGYQIVHPMSNKYIYVIRVKRGSPKKCIVEALEKILKDIEEFREELMSKISEKNR